MILLLRPYRVGDRVEVAGKVGRVRGLDLFMTRLTDLDGLVVFIPNSKAFGEIIVNYAMPETRRIQMDFKIDFEDDIDFALELLKDVARQDPRIVESPAPWAKVTEIGDSTVTVSLRAWTEPVGFRDTRFDLIKACKQRFDAEGLTFAYPHQVAVNERPWKPPAKRRQQQGQKALEESAPPAEPAAPGEVLDQPEEGVKGG
jgi:small conductance mechanosensitive channel